jgi:alkanesulfonate monooxygenase SsuD/methylene tetrahydromethanopterin reductase-like flavin-dependent oxidoreductase (luciferase family)
MLRYALALPDGGECADPNFLVELAVRAEDAGWDGVFLEDYICYQGNGHVPTVDVWTVLGAIAVKTERTILATSVTPLPRRRPWKVAREAAAIDQLSGGRFVLGVGIGDTGESVVGDASLSNFGEVTEARTRAEMLDEGLAIVDGLWRGEPFSFSGKHYQVNDVIFSPRPVQQPRIPIWVGGGYPMRGPTRRALRWDGSMLYKAPQHDTDEAGMTGEDVRTLREMAAGRPFVIAVGGSPRKVDWEAERARIAEVARAGADWWVEWAPPADRATMRAAVNRGPLHVDLDA